MFYIMQQYANLKIYQGLLLTEISKRRKDSYDNQRGYDKL